MPTISAPAGSDRYNEDLTLLTLYTPAGGESSGFLVIRPRFLKEIGKFIFSEGTITAPGRVIEAVEVRELTPAGMVHAERELWIHYHQQEADRNLDRLFAVSAGRGSSA